MSERALNEAERNELQTLAKGLTWAQRVTLQHIVQYHADIRHVGENFRQRAIDLAMFDPPLVDIVADRIFATEAGRSALSHNPGGGR